MNDEKITPGVWFGVAVIAGIGFAMGWAMGRDFGHGHLEPMLYDEANLQWIEPHLFGRDKVIPLRLMRLREYDPETPVWAAQRKDGSWYPFFREENERPED